MHDYSMIYFGETKRRGESLSFSSFDSIIVGIVPRDSSGATFVVGVRDSVKRPARLVSVVCKAEILFGNIVCEI